ncbi:MAG TPA: TOBE domain-containing protein, partial [Paenalcaligenes sp.]|nr:TOBE domain-containing protein [Paenalcaligenes sp.]
FVAGFLGTANIVQGALQNGEFVTAGGQRLQVASSVPNANRIVLRPQNIHLSASQGDMEATVAHREFLGSQIRYLVDTPDGQITVDTLHATDTPPYDEGASVFLKIDSLSAPLLAE